MALWGHAKRHRLLPRRLAIEGQPEGPATYPAASRGWHNPYQYEGIGGNTSLGQGRGGNKTVLWLADLQSGAHEIGARDATANSTAATDAR